MSTQCGQPRKRGGRVVDKATSERVMELARNLPLTHCVLRDAVEDCLVVARFHHVGGHQQIAADFHRLLRGFRFRLQANGVILRQ